MGETSVFGRNLGIWEKLYYLKENTGSENVFPITYIWYKKKLSYSKRGWVAASPSISQINGKAIQQIAVIGLQDIAAVYPSRCCVCGGNICLLQYLRNWNMGTHSVLGSTQIRKGIVYILQLHSYLALYYGYLYETQLTS